MTNLTNFIAISPISSLTRSGHTKQHLMMRLQSFSSRECGASIP